MHWNAEQARRTGTAANSIDPAAEHHASQQELHRYQKNDAEQREVRQAGDDVAAVKQPEALVVDRE